MQRIEYVVGGLELLDAVGPLWEQLNEHHGRRSPHFADEFGERTFADRKTDLLEKASRSTVRVDLARATVAARFVGYCVSSVDREHVGEVDSIYVESEYRGLGIGNVLMERTLSWMDSVGVDSKVIVVAFGNEESFAFYSRYGFFPRHTVLRHRKKCVGAVVTILVLRFQRAGRPAPQRHEPEGGVKHGRAPDSSRSPLPHLVQGERRQVLGVPDKPQAPPATISGVDPGADTRCRPGEDLQNAVVQEDPHP